MKKIFQLLIKFRTLITIACVVIFALVLIGKWNGSVDEGRRKFAKWMKGSDEITTVLDTISAISVEKIEEKADIYTLYADMEMMERVNKTKREKIFFHTDYNAAQIIGQRCHYKFALDKVEFIPVPEEGVIKVRMPKMEYTASTYKTLFVPDDKDVWKDYNSTGAINKCEMKIKKTFCTKENLELATSRAKDIVANILGQLGYKVEFVNHSLERYERPESYRERAITIKRME